MSALVELHGVAKRYARLTAVDGVDLRVDPGERIALVGHNGAGKTTLMKLMLGLLRPSAGTVRVLGVDPAAASAAPNRRAIGFLPENVAFDDALTGRRLLRFYAGLKRFPASECEAQLERVGLRAAADARVRTYSKGMRQRLGLAQALLGAPRLLLLDEPTGGLDPALRQRFYEILDELTRNGSGVLLSSHLLTELEARTDRIVVMGRGRVIAQGSVGRLREQARLPVRFRLTTAGDMARVLERFAGAAELRACGAAQVCFAAPPEDKIAVLRAIAELDAVRDVEVIQPSLEDLYAHFMPDEERPCAP